MIAKPKIMAIFLFLSLAGCSRNTAQFSMTVNQVDELHGFVLKGISITGKITKGCTANDNEYVVKRGTTVVLNTTVRLLEVVDLKNSESFNGEAYNGETVTLYLPDLKKSDVQPGDIVSSAITNCPKGPLRKE